MGRGGGVTKGQGIYQIHHIELVDTSELRYHKDPPASLLPTGRRDQKERWLTLGPVIRKLFTDLEEETAYSLREAQCPSQIPLSLSLTSLISAV